jgi:hypothetical protein
VAPETVRLAGSHRNLAESTPPEAIYPPQHLNLY